MRDDSPHIGTLGERSLHAALKQALAQPDDLLEQRVDGYVIDIVRGDLLIEIQTRSFHAMKRKLRRLLPDHPIHLIHPIAAQLWIRKLGPDGETLIERRKSPKRGTVYDVFRELVSFPDLVGHANLTLEVMLVHEEEIRCKDGQGSWRRKGWSIIDHKLLAIVERHLFREPDDLIALLPDELPDPFTNRQLAETLGIRMDLAQKMTYCLRGMDALAVTGKQGRSHLHQII
ncbi:MAG: hypothetical protein ACFB51_21430 [Anaerolineae bacterium]